jgi:hypothetical protein
MLVSQQAEVFEQMNRCHIKMKIIVSEVNNNNNNNNNNNETHSQSHQARSYPKTKNCLDKGRNKGSCVVLCVL